MVKTFLFAVAAVVMACAPAPIARTEPQAAHSERYRRCMAMTYEPDSLRYFLPTYVHLTQRIFPQRIAGRGSIARWRPDSSKKDGMEALRLTHGLAEWLRKGNDTLVIEVGWHETALPFGRLALVESIRGWQGQAYYALSNHDRPPELNGTVTAIDVLCAEDDMSKRDDGDSLFRHDR